MLCALSCVRVRERGNLVNVEHSDTSPARATTRPARGGRKCLKDPSGTGSTRIAADIRDSAQSRLILPAASSACWLRARCPNGLSALSPVVRATGRPYSIWAIGKGDVRRLAERGVGRAFAAAVMASSGASRSRSDACLGRSSIQSRRPGSCRTAGSAAKSCLARAHPARVIRRSIALSCSRWAISRLPAKRAGLSPYRERPSRTCLVASMTSTTASQGPSESTLMPAMVSSLGSRTAGISQTIPPDRHQHAGSADLLPLGWEPRCSAGDHNRIICKKRRVTGERLPRP